jgi:hypothetical protein
MSKLRDQINEGLKKGMREKDQCRISTIRLIMAALKDKDISARSSGKGEQISDEEILSMLQSMIKQRREAVQAYRDAGRDDLAGREEDEIRVIEQFLPSQFEGEDLEKVIDDTIAELGVSDIKEMGTVMQTLKKRYAGRLDMSMASRIVREKLTA